MRSRRYSPRSFMTDLTSAFAQLLGRQPQEQEIQSLYRVRDALGIDNNDAMWLVLMALEHYEVLYRQIPGQIEAAASNILEHYKEASELAIRASVEQTKAELAEAVSRSARELARNVSRKQAWQWMSVGLLVSA